MSLNQITTALSNALLAKQWTITAAESCTGGGLSYHLTQLSGSSAWFKQGVVTYSNEAKMQLIDVSETSLINYGAVSEQVALEMASGVKQLAQANIGVGITGIAGPTGGTAEKPVGTVWIGLATPSAVTAHCFVFEGDRTAVREQSIEKALQLALESCQSEQP